MIEEATLGEAGSGGAPTGEGWFVLNLGDAAWYRHEDFGAVCDLEGEIRYPELGVKVHVLWPGQPNGLYHADGSQGDFLVLAGECLLLVEGQEGPLRAWDFVHCPPGTEHIFVGAGTGPCAIIMVGARQAPSTEIRYPASDVALRHGAGETEKTSPEEAYAGRADWWRRTELSDAGPPWV